MLMNNDKDADDIIMIIRYARLIYRPFSSKIAAWPGPMNRPSFFSTSDPPDNFDIF